jgi:hypothetical protein
MWMLLDGHRNNEAVLLSEVLADYGPLNRTDHSSQMSREEIDAAEAGDPR